METCKYCYNPLYVKFNCKLNTGYACRNKMCKNYNKVVLIKFNSQRKA